MDLNSIKKVLGTVIAILGISAFFAPCVQAGTPSNIFDDWQGEFISRHTLNTKPEMKEMYQKVAITARENGKNYTAEQVGAVFLQLMRTDFVSIRLKGDTITFYDQEKNTQTVRYKAAGTVPDIYKDHEFEWFAFEAEGDQAQSCKFRYILMLKIHEHQNDQPHFHLRYGSKGIKALTGASLEDWWPTLVSPDFDIKAYVKSLNTKLMVKILP